MTFIDHPPAWTADALCAQVDGDLFFPEKGAHNVAKAARSICATCPVRTACLEHALTTGEQHGVWGGLTADERRKLTGPTRPPIPHGTTAGARAHQRRGETPCAACRDAAAVYQAERKARKAQEGAA